jgi:NAD+ synthase
MAHLYKSQVYELAEYLDIPEEIRRRPPTTDTYSLPQSQEEFYFALPYAKMDLAIHARDNAIAPADAAEALELTPPQVEKVYAIIDAKRKASHYLHLPPRHL